MNIDGKNYRTIWLHPDNSSIVQIIDQRMLPHEFTIEDLNSFDDAFTAIQDMHVRGAGLIGATAGYAIYLAVLDSFKYPNPFDFILKAAQKLKTARPTAINLNYAIDRQLASISTHSTPGQYIETAKTIAQNIADEDAHACLNIGHHGLPLIRNLAKSKPDEPVNILTHCNAGWLAFVDYGSATAPIYAAHKAGIKLHVWVDETRPRNQGSRLTAWELEQQGIPYTVITDNTGGHLMQKGMVDLVLVGSDRTTYTGDVANKIGTYLKALAAKDNDVPFYVALPSSTFDWHIANGVNDIPIEQRDEAEVKSVQGLHKGDLISVQVTSPNAPACNYSFDVTPSRLVTGLITERGICNPNSESILTLFPEHQ